MARPKLPSPTGHCSVQTTTRHRPNCVYPRVYQSASRFRKTQHSCGLQPAFDEQVQNIE